MTRHFIYQMIIMKFESEWKEYRIRKWEKVEQKWIWEKIQGIYLYLLAVVACNEASIFVEAV